MEKKSKNKVKKKNKGYTTEKLISEIEFRNQIIIMS